MDVAEAVVVSKLAIYLLLGLTGFFWTMIMIMLGWYLSMTYKVQLELVKRVTALERLAVTWPACERLRDKCSWGKTAEEVKLKLDNLLAANHAIS